MKRLILFFKASLLYVFLGSVQLHAQSVPVGTPIFEDAYRRAQLLGQIDSSISFTSRPFFPAASLHIDNNFDPDKSLKNNHWTNFGGPYRFVKNIIVFQLLPLTWIQQYNSDHPAGINDGIMIPNRGYQNLFSAGIFVKFGPLSIQFRPEVVYAENRTIERKVYEGIPYNPQIESWYAGHIYGIDLPDRFGEKFYQKRSWGQSSIRLTIGPVSFGLSNENLWWGPGMRNALLMTNNAPGFKHFTLNTVKPFRTPIGSFEGQIIAGQLESSGFSPSKPIDWRYINGVVLSYQPRWVSGLFLGATRSFQVYHEDMGNSLSDYLPVFIPVAKKAIGGIVEDKKGRDQLASLFMRWLWAKGHGEIYFEYGREDHSWNLRDFVTEPSSSAAFIIGLRKLIMINTKKNEYIQVNMELTQLEMDITTRNRLGGSWYLHSSVVHGYTHNGQLLGAGIGPGSNLQTLNISWNKNLNLIGIQFERFVHDNDFFYNNIQDIRANWVDLNAALFSEWNYKNLLFNIKIETIYSMNYKWQYSPKLTFPQVYWNSTKNVFNFHGQLGITYRF